MRLVSYHQDDRAQVGASYDNKIIPMAKIDAELPNSIRQLLADSKLSTLEAKLSAYQSETIGQESVGCLSLIPQPGKIICIGRNYAAHAAGGGAAVPEYPEAFYRGVAPSSFWEIALEILTSR